MQGSIYVFSRDIEDGLGRLYKELLTVFASDSLSANEVVAQQLDELRRHSVRSEVSLKVEPAWRVEEVALDRPKVVTFAVTA